MGKRSTGAGPSVLLAIGAPCYRMNQDARRGAMIAKLGLELERARARYVDDAHRKGVWLGREPAAIVELGDIHTSLLPAGRAKVLHSAMEGTADWLLSVDSDTWMNTAALIRVIELLPDLPAATTAAIGVLVPQDDGRVNAWGEENTRLSASDIQPWRAREVWAIGGAIMFHNLRWHRSVASSNVRWPWVSYSVIATGMPGSYMGEDVFHCEAVKRQGGKVLAVYVPEGVYHNAMVGGESDV